MTTLLRGAGSETVFEVCDGSNWVVQFYPNRWPLPALPADKANLLALYGLRVRRHQACYLHQATDWILYVTDDNRSGWRDRLLAFNDSLDLWIAEIKGWMHNEP